MSNSEYSYHSYLLLTFFTDDDSYGDSSELAKPLNTEELN